MFRLVVVKGPTKSIAIRFIGASCDVVSSYLACDRVTRFRAKHFLQDLTHLATSECSPGQVKRFRITPRVLLRPLCRWTELEPWYSSRTAVTAVLGTMTAQCSV